ncbi:trehalase [Thalassotalea insulae]|uniref:Trehalase n=1 Tax=Thalassotalea insulae TaxID=2056778 RepID=A0ABQ6GRD0_9GAMM|nr:alpha,alpha-trehalase TreF [Thalassotalea insulae]GLX76975.1 trehalase [Thalassotalea insulae]
MSHRTNYSVAAQESLTFFESELFKQVQLSGIFSDSKTFADAIPRRPIKEIIALYQTETKHVAAFNLAEFVEQHFTLPENNEIIVEDSSADIEQQINALWQHLAKPADSGDASSLLPLNHPYVVPGGRFREIYYWDSYFTAQGLIVAKQAALAKSMLDNFVDLQANYGCIPNGNRSYYLSRSQPPILGLLVDLLLPEQQQTEEFLAQYIVAIEREYHFWMQGSEQLTAHYSEHRRVVRMPNGCVLNRYWDDQATPRPESYREDIELAHQSHVTCHTDFYRNIRAACESGWDFSSRWLSDSQSLASICTTRIIPVDLNSLLYKTEMLLASYYRALNETVNSANYLKKAEIRRQAMLGYLWCDNSGYFFDYHLDTHRQTKVKSLAGVLPLFVDLVSEAQALRVAEAVEQDFLQPGGLVTTLVASHQQWDAPNGWAPLQWFAVQGLLNYRHDHLAETVIERWQATVAHYFNDSGKLMEKYNVCQPDIVAGGGEYNVQEGFGWTNGVYQAFAHLSRHVQ